MIWSEGVKAKLGGCQIGPCPLLEQRCSLNTVGDLLITLAPDSPEIPRSAWGFTTACTAAEAALKKLGFARESFDSVKGESLNLKTRKVAVWVEHGGNVPQNKRHSPGGANTSAPRAQTTASTWSFGGGAGNAEMRVGGGAPAPAPAPSPRYQQPSGDPTAWGSSTVPPVPATGGAFAGFGPRPGPSKPATDEGDEEPRLRGCVVTACASGKVEDTVLQPWPPLKYVVLQPRLPLYNIGHSAVVAHSKVS